MPKVSNICLILPHKLTKGIPFAIMKKKRKEEAVKNSPPFFLSVDYCFGDKTALSPRWWHAENTVSPTSKFYYVTEGEISVSTERESVVGQKGDLLFIPAGVRHSFRLTEKGIGEKYWFHFSLLAGEENAFSRLRIPLCLHTEKEAELPRRFARIIDLSQKNGLLERAELSREILSLVIFYLSKAGYEEKSGAEDPIERALRLIRVGDAPVTLREMARLSGYSRSYFVRKFKQRTGTSPIRYLNRIRLERARGLLQTTDAPIGQIMEEVGFCDPAAFSKSYKALFGYPPRHERSK